MTALLLLLLSSPAQAATARRAVMESLATTGTSLFISTNNVRVGVGTGIPLQTLDVRGSIISNSSITASAFFGDGSNLTGLGAVQNSTFGVVPAVTVTQGSLGVCVAGSTRTFTPALSTVDIINFGSVDQANQGADCALGVLMDHGFLPGMGSTTGLRLDNNGYSQDASFVLPNVAVSSGVSHSFCLLASCQTGSININGTGVLFGSAGTFGVRDSSNRGAQGATGATGPAGTPGNVAQSTITYNLTGATTETTNFKLCYATGTLTTDGSSPVQVFYSGDITESGAAGRYCVINFLQDGAFISPASTTIGMGKATNSSAGGSGNGTTSRVFPAPSAGSHSWCISLISPFGDTCTFTSSSVLGNEFGVIELR